MKIIISEEQMTQAQIKMSEMVNKYGLEEVSEMTGIEPTKLIEMGLIVKYNGDLDFRWTDIKNLGELRYIDGSLCLYKTKVKELGNLEYIGGDFIIMASPLSKLSDEKIRSQVEIKGEILR